LAAQLIGADKAADESFPRLLGAQQVDRGAISLTVTENVS
jgi:hypothetical protein